MPATNLRVELIGRTENAESVLYAAFKQCYSGVDAATIFHYAQYKRRIGDTEIIKAQRQLITSLLDSGHDSPVEHVAYTFAVAGVSRALSHQLVRHRIASYSQQSQRYVSTSGFDYIVPPSIASHPTAALQFESMMDVLDAAYDSLVGKLVKSGIPESKAKEDARFVLPNACETKIVVTMNCRALLNFFELRCCNRAQWEIRAMANEMLRLCRQALPVVFDAAGAKCERLGYCPEIEKLRCGKMPGRK